jgi:hypothetical protein
MINISDSKHLTVDSGTIVEIHKNCKIRGHYHIDVPFKIVCDLKDIPKEKHSIVIQTLMQI